MYQPVNVTRDRTRDVTVADAVGQYNTRDVIAAGENCRKIAAGVGSGGDCDYVGFEAGEFERAMSAFIAGPQFHASEWTDDGGCALDDFGLDFLKLHFLTPESLCGFMG
jgi:hypothetical protein